MKHVDLFGAVGRALEDDDSTEVKRLFAAHTDLLHEMTPLGTWLHYVAGAGNVDLVMHLVGLGLDVNAPDHREGKLAINSAASNGQADVVRYLLGQGSRLDTSTETRNPLFAAIMGRSPTVARLLLERGIDATVRYGDENSKPKSAVSFALWRGEQEIAHIIADHIAGGDPASAEAILEEEGLIAARQGPARPTRILPTEEDLNGK